jgi:DNA primase
LLLDEQFPDTGEPAMISRSGPVAPQAQRPVVAHRDKKTPPPATRVIVNPPLDFQLKHLDPRHPYLPGRGFSPETIDHFGLGFCGKGLMKDRIVIPLHDPAGQLIGYAGRVVDDAAIGEENPRYRFPSGREKDGVRYEFQKSAFLYNGFEVGGNLDELVIVESFTATWWLVQHGNIPVVAVMGASCSPEQGRLVTEMTASDGVVTILTDGDDAGVRCAQSIFTEVAPGRRVRWAKLSSARQPTDLTADELMQVLM